MIETKFENMNDVNAELVTIVMPYPVRVGEYVEINDITWLVHTVSWIITTDPITYTQTFSMHVRVK